MQKDGVDALKKMAQMAKNRLRNKVNEKENKMIKSKGGFTILYCGGNDIKSKLITKEDVKFYDKVKLMLQEENVFNPLARLIDNKVYSKLDELAKERYLFELIDKYKICKDRCEREKEIANG